MYLIHNGDYINEKIYRKGFNLCNRSGYYK